MLVALAVVAWLLVAPSLAWLMRRHGYDPIPWLLLGLLWSPLALILALVELVWPTPCAPRVLAPGRVQQGSLDVLVNLDSSPRSVEAAAKAIPQLRPRLRTLSLIRVLPRGVGPRIQQRNAGELRRDATALGGPDAQLVLLFGRPEQALGQYAATANHPLVITTGQPGLAQALRQGGQEAVEATDLVRLLPTTSRRMTTRRTRLRQGESGSAAHRCSKGRSEPPSDRISPFVAAPEPRP
jgi:hypothetical protein